ncbi:MAG: thiol:disulfide interchange protein DsbA/DsbL [Thiotrichales bacterium]
MTLTRRDFHRFVLAALGAGALPAIAKTLEPGRDFELIEPPQTGVEPQKIEVLEFFAYGCPHCMEFHPILMDWIKRQPPDVSFKRVPVSFNRAAWANLARLFYALQATGDLARLDEDIFRALHHERVKLYTQPAIVAWVKQHGVDAKRFTDAFESLGATSRLKRDEQRVNDYRVQSVPLLTIDGRYAVVAKNAKTFRDHLAIADTLLAQTRAERKAAA